MPESTLPAVVITRPLAQGRILQDRLAAIGRQAILYPLLEIGPLDDYTALDAVLRNLEQYALVAFVSPNAIDAAFKRRPAWPPSVPLAVMGEGSRRALEAHGVNVARTPVYFPLDPERTDSQTLLAVLDLPSLAGREVLILRGESGRELLADALRLAGVLVTQVAAYRRTAPGLDIAARTCLRTLIDTGCEWIITSSEALHVLVAQAAQIGADGQDQAYVVKLQQMVLIVPHVRIAETANLLGFCNVIRTGSGDERLLAALQFRNE